MIAVIIISNKGDLLDYQLAKSFLKKYNYKSVKYLTNLVSLRFRISDFSQLLGGLEMTINRFKDGIMVSKSLNHDNIMIMLLPLDVDLQRINKVLQNIKNVFPSLYSVDIKN